MQDVFTVGLDKIEEIFRNLVYIRKKKIVHLNDFLKMKKLVQYKLKGIAKKYSSAIFLFISNQQNINYYKNLKLEVLSNQDDTAL